MHAEASTTTGLTGTYRYAISFMTGSTEGAIGPASAPITVAGQRIDLSYIELGPAGTTARRIYRDSGSGFQLIATLNNSDPTPTVLIDDSTRTAGAAPAGSGPIYIDVTYNATPGATLDYGSILDTGNEFTVTGGTTPATIAFNGAPTPISLVSDPTSGALVPTPMPQNSGESTADWYTRLTQAGVKTFRYDATSSTTVWPTGTLTIDFLPYSSTGDGWQDSTGNAGTSDTEHTDRSITIQGPTGALTDPLGGSSVDVNKLNGRNYIDVTFGTAQIPTGYTLDANSVLDLAPEFTLSGSGVGTVTIDNSTAPAHIGTGTTYRYWLNGFFSSQSTADPVTGALTVPPDVTLTFIPGSFSFAPTDASVETGTATVTVDDALYLDVTFLTPPTGYAVDLGSLDGHEFTLVDHTTSTKTISVDTSFAPVAIASTPNTFRFRVTGTYQRPVAAHDSVAAVPGDTIDVTFVPGSWSLVPVSGTPTSLDLHNLSSTNNTHGWIDVTFSPVSGSALTGSITGPEITLGGAGLGTGPGAAHLISATPLALGGGRYRYYVAGTYTTGAVNVTFVGGTLHSGGYDNIEQHASFTSQGPTADLIDPAAGTVVGAGELNSRGYIDVRFNTGTKTLDASTVSDDGAEFTLHAGSFTGTFALTTQAPVQLDPTGDPNLWRYWTTGTVATGTPIIDFTDDSFGFTDGTLSGHVASQSLTGAAATAVIHYLDVRLTAPTGDTIDAATVNGGEFVLSGAGAAGVSLSGATTRISSTTWRYYFTGAFVAGGVTVDFQANSFRSVDGVGGSAHQTLGGQEKFTVQQLTADVADPQNGGSIGADVLNSRGYFDVTFALPAYATGIDVGSITDLTPEFTVSDPLYIT